MTLEQIGKRLCAIGRDESIPMTLERRRQLLGECDALLTFLHAADAELQRGREAEALLREWVNANIEADAYLMQSAINGLADMFVGRCNKAYKAMVEWLSAHPPREGDTR